MTLDSGMCNNKGGRDPITNKLVGRIEVVEDELRSLNETVNTEDVNAENVNSSSLDSAIATIKQLSADNVNVSGTIETKKVTTNEIGTDKASIKEVTTDIKMQNVKVNELTAAKLKTTDIEIVNPNFTNINVTGQASINKQTSEEIKTKKLNVTQELVLNDGINVNSVNVGDARINDLNAEYANIDAANVDTVTSDAIQTKDLDVSETLNALDAKAENIYAGKIETTHTKTVDIDAGVYKRNDNFYINIDIAPGAKGIIKLPKFDGTGKFYFVDDENNSVISATVINNKTEMQSTLVNYSQVGLYLTDINVGIDGNIYFGISDQANIKVMYYTLDINNEFIEVPKQLPGVTTFDDIDVDYAYAPEFLNRVVILGSPLMDRVNNWGLDINGSLKATQFAYPEISKVPALEVTGLAWFKENILVLGKIIGELNNKLTLVVKTNENGDVVDSVDYDNFEPTIVDLIDKAYKDDEGNVIKDTYLKTAIAERDYVKKLQIGAATTDNYTGICPLDENGQIPISYLPTDALVFKGLWNASTNRPHISKGTGTKGDFYICSVAGTQDLGSGSIEFSINDTVIYDGDIWHRVASSSTRTELLNIIGNSSSTATGLMTAAQFNKLNNISAGAEVNVQSDWTQTNTASDSYIKNKPNLKPVATSGQFKDLSSKPTLSFTTGSIKLSDDSGWSTACAIPALNVVSLTLSQYKALSSKDPNTVYAITGE